METISCQFCSETTPAQYSLCVHCEKQIKCRECGSKTYPGKSRCMECGKPLIDLTSQASDMQKPRNQFSHSISRQGDNYSEERKFDFTDDAAKIMAPYILTSTNTQSQFRNGTEKPEDVGFKMIGNGKNHDSEHSGGENGLDEKGASFNSNEKVVAKTTAEFLNGLFQKFGDSWTLDNSELKAESKGDFVKRLTCLFVQFRQNNGSDAVPRTEVNTVLKYYGVHDSNVRTWLSKERTLLQVTEKDLRVIGPGSQFVKQVVEEIQDNNFLGKWKIGTVQKRNSRANNKEDKSEHGESES